MDLEHRAEGEKTAYLAFGVALFFLWFAFWAVLRAPRVVGSVGSRVPAARADLATLSSKLGAFRRDCGRYPTSEEGLNALTNAPDDLAGKWHGPYLSKPLGNDPWGNPYVYDAVGKGYKATSYAADGQAGGAGEDADVIETR